MAAARDVVTGIPRPLLPVTLILMAGLSACEGPSSPLVISGSTMGTSYAVKIAASDLPEDKVILERNIQERLNTLDSLLSSYREDSDVNRFNDHQSMNWLDVSEDMLRVVKTGLDVGRASEGALDMTLGPLVNLWGFGPDRVEPQMPPDPQKLQELLGITGQDKLEIRESPPAIRKLRAGIQLDLSAVAKGYAVDQIAQLLDDNGFTDYLVEIGGEVRARGRRVQGSPWRVGVEGPLAQSRTISSVATLVDMALATSGDYRNFFEADGQRYSHIIDPRTGYPVAHGLGSASVISPTALEADAWATALLVLGPERGLAIAEREDIAAQLVLRTETGTETLHTSGFLEHLESGSMADK